MTKRITVVRLLPWAGAAGKPCYLSSDSSGSYLSRLADNMEAVQLGLATDLIEEAGTVLNTRSWTQGELHLLAVQLLESLTDVHRIAKSRGACLPRPAGDDPDVNDGQDDETDDSPARPTEVSV